MLQAASGLASQQWIIICFHQCEQPYERILKKSFTIEIPMILGDPSVVMANKETGE